MFTTPYLLRVLAGPGLTWDIPTQNKSLYLTFDDGPNPDTTPLILDILARHNAKATFFCVGENVERYPELYQNILAEGHAVGNHSYNHLKGWKNQTKNYVENVDKCSKVVSSILFRPPYGKMKHAQRKALRKRFRIIMWSVLSRDYDRKVNKETCFEKTWKYTKPGAIIVFHDHAKALEKVKWVLPKYLEKAIGSAFNFKTL